MALFQRLASHEFNGVDRQIIEEACELAKTYPFAGIAHMLRNLPEEFIAHQNEYHAAFNDIHHRARRDAYDQGRLARPFQWPHSFPNCTPALRQFVDRWIAEELPRKIHAKCLILIGPTNTGKTAFATSLPGFYNFIAGPWNLDEFNPYAAYTIYHYVSWDDFAVNGYPNKKLLFSQPGRIHTVDNVGNAAIVDVLQPVIVLLTANDQGSLANVPSTNDVANGHAEPHFWNQHAYIYRMRNNERFRRH